MKGVKEVIVGYTSGETEWPTYRQIQDHTEGLRVTFNPKEVTYEELLVSFFSQHSATSPPYSRQYRSTILYHTEEQKAVAEKVLSEVSVWAKGRRVYTTIEPATDFYRAEEYHQKYIEKARGR